MPLIEVGEMRNRQTPIDWGLRNALYPQSARDIVFVCERTQSVVPVAGPIDLGRVTKPRIPILIERQRDRLAKAAGCTRHAGKVVWIPNVRNVRTVTGGHIQDR